ncbi:MAG: FHA domain-containing protein [Anaerolineae bacterium]|nr:FHA domain-containing protein [Anaerolineae bacterium]
MTDEQNPKLTRIFKNEETTSPMEPREPSPNTSMLTPAWRLRLKIGDQTIIVPVNDRTVVGRVLEGEHDVDFDLAPFGAYHFGVSRVHAAFCLVDGLLYVEDLNSTNGTRINGFQLTPRQKYRLRDSDELEFARLRLQLKFERPGDA